MLRHLLFAMLAASSALAQTNLSKMVGMVSDSSGAVIAGCEVSITNTGTGIVGQTRTNESGVYLLPGLIPGNYRVDMQAAGFRKRQFSSVVLQTAQELRLDAVLEVGPVTEAVDVTASIQPLQQETAEISETFVSNEIQNMPINGRSPYALLDLAAGVVGGSEDPSEPDKGGATSINGSRMGTNSFSVDGASVMHIGGLNERAGSIESIAEFKLYSHTYSAEFGRTSGGVVQFGVKSGSRQFHGSVYGYRRDSSLAANSWANNARGIVPIQRNRDEFGATIGGPLPFLKKKGFFFLSYEGNRDRYPVTRTRTIPAPDVVAGNFSAYNSIVNDPLSRSPFPGNVLPQSRKDPAAVKLLAMMPKPNATGTLSAAYGIEANNWVRSTTFSWPMNHGVSRYDYNPTAKDKFFLTLAIINEGPRDQGREFDNALVTLIGPDIRIMPRSSFGYTRFLRSNLVNEFTVNIQRDPRESTPWYADYDVTKELGIQRKTGPGIPTFAISGGYGNYGASTRQKWVNQPAGGANSLTWQHNRHTLKVGAQIYQNQFWYDSAGTGAGTYNFTGEISGLGSRGNGNPINAVADLLLGAVKTASAPMPQIPINRTNYNLGIYINDNWKVSRRLTLNLGLREEYETRQIVKNNVYSRIDIKTGELLVAGKNATRNLNLEEPRFNLAPRLGVAYLVGKGTVLRSGFAVFHSSFWVNNGEYISYPGFTAAQSFPNRGLGVAQPWTLSQGFPVEDAPPVTDPFERFALATQSSPFSVSAVSYAPTYDIPRTLQWNFGIQRALPGGFVADVAYVASRSSRQARSIPANNPNLDKAEALVIQRVATQSVRPFPTVSAFNAVWYDASAWYNSVQGKLMRRFKGGFSLTANFTFSKNMDTATGRDDVFQLPWQFQEIEKSISSLDRPRVMNAGWVWDLPFGKRGYIFRDNRILSALLGGFQVNGIFKAADGLPLTITQTRTNLVLVNQRPDVRDPGNLGGYVSQPTYGNATRTWLAAPNDPSFPFVASGNLAIGNLGRNTSRGPGFVNFNMGAFREFRITERYKVQFRAEAYNALNHVNYSRPASRDMNNINYGLITGSAAARQLQLGGRLTF